MVADKIEKFLRNDEPERKKLQKLLADRVANVLPLTAEKVEKELGRASSSLYDEHGGAVDEVDYEQDNTHGTTRTKELQFLSRFFRKQWVHTDLNDTNILFRAIDLHTKCFEYGAVLDFGDSCFDYCLYDIGITAAYACMYQETLSIAEIIANICYGYFHQGATQFPKECLQYVYAVAVGRTLLSLTCACEQIFLQPDNEYVAHTAQPLKDVAGKHLTEFVCSGKGSH